MFVPNRIPAFTLPPQELEMMSILHSITSSRLEPFAEASWWPEGTVHTADDILIRGTSIVDAARTGRTPLVRIGQVPSVHGRLSGRQDFVTVVLTRIEHIERFSGLQRPDVWIDAALRDCAPILAAARLLGRRSAAHTRRTRLRAEADAGSRMPARLPADLRVGDLLAIPCATTVPRNRVAGGAPMRAAEEEDDEGGMAPRCGR